jgi:hypothetical protein
MNKSLIKFSEVQIGPSIFRPSWLSEEPDRGDTYDYFTDSATNITTCKFIH